MSFLRGGSHIPRILRRCPVQNHVCIQSRIPAHRGFHAGPSLWGIKSQLLKDVGEGITEVQIIQWYVEEGAHIEEWKPLCQYQSDKAVDDITSRYEGVIRKLHFEADDTIPTGQVCCEIKARLDTLTTEQALCDIEVDDGKYPDDTPPSEPKKDPVSTQHESDVAATQAAETSQAEPMVLGRPPSAHTSLATPAVRGLLKTHGVNILDITGTGKDGRVLKEDVLRFVEAKSTTVPSTALDTRQTETETKLTPIQSAMFKTMTKSLNTPHLLYTDELKVSSITSIRKRLAAIKKITFLPFVVKAVSLALNDYPILNARVDASDPARPSLIMRSKHNIGIAMDTPNGLIVPNIKDVASRSIFDIATEVARLSALGKEGKLTPTDLNGGTITVSNIGNIGGTYVAPVIVPTEVSILGIGRTRTVPVFEEAGEGKVVPAELVNFSWSADHRVIDGATMARMGNRVKELIEDPELMLLDLR